MTKLELEAMVARHEMQRLEFKESCDAEAIEFTGKAEHERYWEYPADALRETIANAICHRDYGSSYATQIKIFEDRLVVISPGQLPFDMPFEQLFNPNHASHPRNKMLAQAFYDMHIIEQYGSGIERIRGSKKTGGYFPYDAAVDGKEPAQ